MARAAAKRNQGAGKAARSVAVDQKGSRRKAEKTLEDQLFFNRLRSHAKWVFVLLAVVFGASFVFLGVGSGNAGLGDVFNNLFGGGSAPSVEKLQKELAANPRDKTVLTNLAQALQRDGRTAEAITAYRTYLQERPKDRDILFNLALLYQAQAQAAANDANNALRDASLADPAAQFTPGSGALGRALGSLIDPLSQTASNNAEAAYREAASRFQTANQDALGVYKQLAALSPHDSSALLRYAQAAEGAQDLQTAIKVYGTFLKRFPNDPLKADVKKRISELKKQVAKQKSSVQVPGSQAGG
jgi:tetratricopeptide (TPR) repeat protein